MSKQQKIFIAIFIVFVCVILVYVRFMPRREVAKNTGYQNVTFPSLDVALVIFSNNYKKALFGTENIDDLTVTENMQKTAAVWENIFIQFGELQPPNYSKTEVWKDKIDNITRAIREANQFVKEKNWERAHQSLTAGGEMLQDIYQENKLDNLNARQFQLYLSTRPLIKEFDHKTVKKLLPDAKVALALLKQYDLPGNYKIDLARLEDILGRLDKLDGPDFEQARRELELAVRNIYLQY